VPSFPAQLALSALVMGGLVTGLFLVGQRSHSAPHDPTALRANEGREDAPARALTNSGAAPRSSDVRALLGAQAWLVVDFDGSLAGSSPFESSRPECKSVPLPARVGLSVGTADANGLGSSAASGTRARPITSGGGVLSLVAPRVSPEFWSCVRAEVLEAGGRSVGTEANEEMLESPSGVILHSHGHLLFVSDVGQASSLQGLAHGRAPSASAVGPHPALVASLGARRSADRPPLLATLHLPRDWLADLGPEALQTPLRHLVAGALRADADGSATGALECMQPGCEELAAFLLRARGDLGRLLPGALGDITARSWSASFERSSNDRGVIRLRWVPTEMTFSDWASRLWKLAGVGGVELAPPPPEAGSDSSPD
jgi:hypothetical protein